MKTDQDNSRTGFTRDTAMFAGLLTLNTLILIQLLSINQLDKWLNVAILVSAIALPLLALQLVSISIQERYQGIAVPRIVQVTYSVSPLLVWLLILFMFLHFGVSAAVIFFLISVFAVLMVVLLLRGRSEQRHEL